MPARDPWQLRLPGLAGSGGFALEDQQAALRWVRRNIAAFGGDPDNVALVGAAVPHVQSLGDPRPASR